MSEDKAIRILIPIEACPKLVWCIVRIIKKEIKTRIPEEMYIASLLLVPLSLNKEIK